MDTLRVGLADRGYPIFIGHGLLAAPDAWLSQLRSRDLFVVTNVTVGPLWLPQLTRALVGHRVASIALPDGEAYKTLATLGTVFDALVAHRMNRDCTVIALGGGVVGDMAGFAAACYQRGVAFAQVPTTLLAQVDSSVGGKTAVDHAGGKNLIGAFHQPVAVIADTATLSTLPDRELRAGLAEVIKYGLAFDREFLVWIELQLDALLRRDPAALAHAIRRSCEIKAKVVEVDEREQGPRALLNLGHTFGHAIETAGGYSTWLHGEAVAMGMLLAADMSCRLGSLSSAEVDRVRTLLVRAGLPVTTPRIGMHRMLEVMAMDKKVQASRIRLVLLERVGTAVVTADYPDSVLEAVLAEHVGRDSA